VTALEKDYPTAAGPFPALRGVGLRVDAGEYVAVMGPSGSGKSTFMNILGCLDRPTAGTYRLDGLEGARLERSALAEGPNRTRGFVFPGFNLLPRANLLVNVGLPLVYAGVGRADRQKRAMVELEKVGLGSHAASLPSKVSGGQQQRAAIARALINRPRLLLADEPTGNLDSQTSEEILSVFEGLNRQGITIILVTHESDVAAHAQRLVRFRDGRIVHDAPSISKAPAVHDAPAAHDASMIPDEPAGAHPC
jgi:putative ABC transport system ATP-binding protein